MIELAKHRDSRWVTAWGGLLAAAIVVGVLYRRGRPIEVGAVPWVGRWGFDVALVPRLLVCAVALSLSVWLAPLVVTRLRSRFVVGLAVIATIVLTGALAWSGPNDTHWVSLRFGYGAHTHLVDDWHGPAAFLDRYVSRMPYLTAHLRAHPPGLVLLLWFLGRLGFLGRSFDLAFMLGAGGVITGAVLVTTRNLAGDAAMRAAAPFVVIAPVLVWRTNPDVIFAALAAAAVAGFAYATSHRAGATRPLLAALAGSAFGVSLLFTYGVILIALPLAAIGWYRRAWRDTAIAAMAALVVLAVPALWGFSWIAGLFETRVQYHESIAAIRGYRYWLLGNAAIYAALLGPAMFAAIARLHAAPLRVLVWGGVSSAIVAGLSGLSSAETERIWQPFVPFALVSGAALWHSARTNSFDVTAARRWLALQAGVALAFQSVLWTRV